jgi:hypothetical protein
MPPRVETPRRAPVMKEEAQASFFTGVKETAEDAAFETEIELRPEQRPKGPPPHPLYSPPTNPLIESFIARRAAARK